ncbi:MAG TPA: carbohydrate kinase [Ktedonobacterales bacterium]|jgi:fructokinase|nr:carbohydrate kinase [Ktedonobacterales bacterium]
MSAGEALAGASARPDLLDVLCVGETLIDMISVEEADSLAHATRFERRLGGSPANVATQLARLGARVALASKVGAGAFGSFCRETLSDAGVSTDYLVMDSATHTTVVFVTRTGGTPDFEAFRAGDTQLRPDDLPAGAAQVARALHTTVFALCAEPSRSTIRNLLREAKAAGALISLDPNYHPRIWRDRDEALEVLRALYPLVDVTKPSLDDAERLFGPGKRPESYLDDFHDLGARVALLSMGSRGVWRSDTSGRVFYPAQAIVARNATGAGDAFWAGLLLASLDSQPPAVQIRFAQEVARRWLLGEPARLTSADRAAIYSRVVG